MWIQKAWLQDASSQSHVILTLSLSLPSGVRGDQHSPDRGFLSWASWLPHSFLSRTSPGSQLPAKGGWRARIRAGELWSAVFDSLRPGQPVGRLHRQSRPWPRPLLCSRACSSDHCQYSLPSPISQVDWPHVWWTSFSFIFKATLVFSNTGESYRPGSWLSLLHLLSLKAFFSLFIYLFLVCYVAMRASCSHGEPRLLFVEVRRLLNAVASLVAEHRLQAHWLSSCSAWA